MVESTAQSSRELPSAGADAPGPSIDSFPDRIVDVDALEELLSRPTPALLRAFNRIDGDILVLGVGGKMGPTLARMAARAVEAKAHGSKQRVIGVARFSDKLCRDRLESVGVSTIACDLLDQAQLARLPDAPNVIYMAGMKFGSSGNEPLTWAMNTLLPARVCERYRDAKVVAFGTGNVYGLCPAVRGGSLETDSLNPTGDYAMSCLGRERMVQYASETNGTQSAIIRLNYACEMRYGVIADLARKVWENREIDMSMGCLNAIWQGDANAMSLAALARVSSPTLLLNIAGPELLSIRRLAISLGERMKREPTFVGVESPDAILSNAQKSHRLFGYPTVSIDRILDWTADWISRGGASLGKPTHYEARDGKY